MFEVIISSVITGKVRRKLFETRDEADQHVDRFFEPRDDFKRAPLPRNYRIEVYRRELPVVHTMPAPAVATEAA